MARGKDKLVRQISGVGYFAEVWVDVEQDAATEGLTVTFNDVYAVKYRTPAHRRVRSQLPIRS
jgi:hypothetical protein